MIPEMRRGKLKNNLPLAVASPLYRLKHSGARLSTWRTRYPLDDATGGMSSQPLLFQSAGRSGTTLLRSMLVAGGDIAIPPQSFVLCLIALRFHAMQRDTWTEQVEDVLHAFEHSRSFHLWDLDLEGIRESAHRMPRPRQNLACLLDLVYRGYGAAHFPDADRWGDQSIENTLQIQWLVKVFPRAKYLHLLRDGRDVAASWREQGKTIDAAIEDWLIALEKVAYLRKRVPAECFLEVRYEDLVTSPEATLEQICSFVGLPYRAAMLDYWQRDSTVEHRDDPELHGNLARPVFSGSVDRWRQRLTAPEQEQVESRLGDDLQRLGYHG